MKVIKLKPNTPGTRHTIKIDKSLLLKKNFLFKNLIQYKHQFMGRSSTTGHITSRHKGGGSKKKYRFLDKTNEKNGNQKKKSKTKRRRRKRGFLL